MRTASKLALSYVLSFLIGLTILFGNYNKADTWGPIDPTEGFISLPFNRSFYHIQKPYDVQEDERYSFCDGVHRRWVYSTDKPHTTTSLTKPRTEIAIHGYNYSSRVWQYEGYSFVPRGTTNVCIMQHRPKSRREGNFAKLPSNMSSLITPLPGPVVALSLEEVRRLIEEKVAKAIQAIKRKQLSLPSPSENLQSHLSQDILNIKLSRKFNFPQITL
ncbi:hypothetical protein CRG98_048217 [Punica granatum]|uniref:Alginate lyase 2 domain-containing protein n=1 Tax=Punica granatum TaxID=22663 RepID=A0A2I0HI79_PUNGR|nr:hypothetical protein CRG98_048217 [Punica granatum]